jgi:hypothetical protein
MDQQAAKAVASAGILNKCKNLPRKRSLSKMSPVQIAQAIVFI